MESPSCSEIDKIHINVIININEKKSYWILFETYNKFVHINIDELVHWCKYPLIFE